MELEGVVRNGVIVPDDAAPLDKPKSFGERFAAFKGAAPDLPADLAEQHDHYRLGTPKR